MWYLSFGFIGVFIAYIACGYSICYPTSYRAFIPKKYDKEYKEYERLCKKNLGKVVYARVLTQEEKAGINEVIKNNKHKYLLQAHYVRISENIYEIRRTIYVDYFLRTGKETANLDDAINEELLQLKNPDFVVYQSIATYIYDTNWREIMPLSKGGEFFARFEKTMSKESQAYSLKDFADKILSQTQNIGDKKDIFISEDNISFGRPDFIYPLISY